jgi:hypothetical protein
MVDIGVIEKKDCYTIFSIIKPVFWAGETCP